MALSIVVFAVVADIAVEETIRSRRERARREREGVERAVEFAVVLATERLRATFEQDPHPAPARVFTDLDPVEFESRWGAKWAIELVIERSEVRERRDVLVRGDSTQRSRVVTVPIVYASEATEASLADALASHESSAESAPERAALASLLRELSESGRGPTFTEWREELLVSRASVLPMMSESRLRTWLDRIDAVARLRRTSLHPERLTGSDRGRHATDGAVIALGYSGRFRVRITVLPAGRRDRSVPASPGSVFHREVKLWSRCRIDRQGRAWDGADLQPGGIEGAGLFVGPENRDDRGFAWEEAETRHGPRSSLATITADRSKPLYGRGVLRWSSAGVEIEPPPGDGSAPVRLGPPGTDVARLEGRLIVALDTGELRLVDESGRRIRSRVLTSEPTRLHELPLVDRVVAATTDRWFVVDRELEVVASGTISLAFGSGTELAHSDGADGVWACDRAGQRWVHARRSIDTGRWIVRRSAPGSVATGAELVGAIPASPFAITRLGDRLTLWRVDDAGIHVRGVVALPDAEGRATLDPSGRGVWWWGDGDPVHRGLSLGRRHFEWGLQIVARPPRVLPVSTDGFVAMGRGTLSGHWSGEEIEASGSVDSGSSVLDGPDLSDLTGRGVISAPERSEEWTFVSTASDPPSRRELGAFEGAFGLTLEASRSAAQVGSADDAVVSRWTHRYRARFVPSAAWVADHHPASLSVAEIASFSVTGPATRTWTRRLELRRRPIDAAWCLAATFELSGAPWRVVVTRRSTRGATEVLEPWSVGEAELVPDAVEISGADDAPAGRAQSIIANWRTPTGADGRLGLSTRTGEPGVARVAPIPEAIELEPLGGTWSSGGDLGGRVFRGVLRDLWATSNPEASVEREVRPHCRLRWVSPRLYPAGASLRRVCVEGSSSVRERLEGAVRLVGARSRRVADLDGSALDGGVGADALALAEPFRVVLELTWMPSEADPVLIEAIDVEVWEPPHGSGALRLESVGP